MGEIERKEQTLSKDIIYREDAIKAINARSNWYQVTCNGKQIAVMLMAKDVNEILEKVPSADRSQGEWIVHKERTEVNDGFIDFFPTEYECSNCGLKQSMYFINSKPSNFCPNCGAEMKGADDEWTA